jgi:hypothetical protein
VVAHWQSRWRRPPAGQGAGPGSLGILVRETGCQLPRSCPAAASESESDRRRGKIMIGNACAAVTVPSQLEHFPSEAAARSRPAGEMLKL